jgi:predicted Rossmann-fold nucleotide-binding protein
VGLLDVSGYWRPLLALLDHAVEQRFVLPEHRGDLISRTDPDDLLDALADWTPSHADKWIDRVGRATLEPGIG